MAKTKKILAIVLALVMMLCMMPMAFAGSDEFIAEGDFLYTVENGEATIYGVHDDDGCTASGDLVIPSEIGGYPVTTIGDGAFSTAINLKSVKIPASVKRIGVVAFGTCLSLESVEISEGVEIIDTNAFCACYILKSIKIPSTVTKIGDYAFTFCPCLESITIPAGVKTIGEGAFTNCPSLKEATIETEDAVIGEIAIGYNDLKFAEGKTADMFKAAILKAVANGLFTEEPAEDAEEIDLDSFFVEAEDDEMFKNDMVIYGVVGSTSETYANENEIKFVDINEKPAESEEEPTNPESIKDMLKKLSDMLQKLLTFISKIVAFFKGAK